MRSGSREKLLRDARFHLELFVWLRLVPLLAAREDFADLLARIEPAGITYLGMEPARILKRIKRRLRHPWLMRQQRCLREGLIAYRLLKRAGYRPALHFGIDRATIAKNQLGAHCWLTLNGEIVLNPPSAGYVEIYRLGGADTAAARNTLDG